MPTLTPELLAWLKTVDTPTICNAIEPFNVRDRTVGFCGYNVKSLFPEMGMMVGYAVTATGDSMFPGAPKGRDGMLKFWQAVEASPHPAVCVLKDVGPRPTHSCFCGDVMANTARRVGAVGLVTDAGVRDVNEVRALGFHYFSPGLVPAHGTWGVLEVGVPVVIDGVLIRPGDLLHGDANGVTTIPWEIVEELPGAVERIRKAEAEMIGFINSPEFTLDELARRWGVYPKTS